MDDPLVTVLVEELLEVLDSAYLGPAKRIYCYRTMQGTVPAKDFLQSLGDEPAGSYAVSFKKHCQGFQLRGEKWHPWNDKGCEDLFEFKDIQSKSRVLHTTDRGGLTILLYGFTGKKEKRVKQVHVNMARRLRDEYLTRKQEIETRLAGQAYSRKQNRR